MFDKQDGTHKDIQDLILYLRISGDGTHTYQVLAGDPVRIFSKSGVDKVLQNGGLSGMVFPGDRRLFENLLNRVRFQKMDPVRLRVFKRGDDVQWIWLQACHVLTDTDEMVEYVLLINAELGAVQTMQSKRAISDIIADLSETTAILTGQIGLDEMLTVLLKKLHYSVPYQFLEIISLNQEGEIDTQVTFPSISPLHNLRGKSPMGFPNIRRIHESKTPIVYSEARSVATGEYNPGFEWLHAYIGYPILINDQVVGIINAFSTESNQYISQHVPLVRLFANQAAIAIDRAKRDNELKRSIAESDTLRESISTVASADSRRMILTRILEQLCKVVPFDTASAGYIVRDGLEIVSVYGFENEDDILGLTFPIQPDNPSGKVFNEKKALIIDDTQLALDKFPHFGNAPHNIIRSWLGIPVIYKESFVGILALDSHTPNHFKSYHVQLAVSFADQLAVTLENARLFENARRRALESETLHHVIATVASTLNLHEVTLRILEELQKVMPYQNATLLMREGDTMVVTASRGEQKPEEFIGRRYSLLENTPDAAVLKTKKPVIVANIHFSGEYIFSEINSPSTVSLIVVPLILEDEVIGEIAVSSDQKAFFHEDHARLIASFADQVVIAIKNARLYNTLQDELKQRTKMEEELRRMASTDALTGALNRGHFYKLARDEFRRAVRYQHELSIILIDIDHFKSINDTYGHASGDTVLKEFTQVCQDNIRESDRFARYGGEEFIIMLPEDDGESAMILAERLRKSVENLKVSTPAGEIQITISLGISTLGKEKGMGLEKLIKRADEALYIAKEQRNQVLIWQSPV